MGVLDGAEDFPEKRTRGIAHPDEVLPGQKRRRPEFLLGILLQLLQGKFIIVEEAVTPQTVEAVEFQVEGEIRLPEEAFQPVRPHFADIHEEHVSPDEGQDRLRLLPGETESLEDRGRDLFPPPDMAVEMHSGFVFRTGDRLAHVVEENRPGETQVGASIPSGEKGEHPQGMFPDIPLGMEDRGLVDSPEGLNLGKDLGKETAFRQEFQPLPRPAARQYPVELLPDTLGADPPDGRRLPPDGGQGRRVDL